MIDRGSNRRGDHRGAALVELAFALPLVVMLIVGMVSAGVAYNHQLSLTHAAREGGRYAATLPVTNFGPETAIASFNAWLDDVAAAVVTDATGTLAPGTPGFFVCVAHVDPSPGGTTQRRVDNGVAVSYSSNTCFADFAAGPAANQRRVQVRVARDADFNALVFSTTITLDSEAVNRFEAALGS